MDTWAILTVVSILSVSGLFTLWQTRTWRRPRPNWREELQKSWGSAAQDDAALRTWTEDDENKWRSNQPAA